MGQPLVSRNRKPKKSGFLLCSIHSFFEGLKTASLASHRPLNKLLLSAKCFNNVRTAATKMADNERHFVSNFTNFQIKSSNKMYGKLATWQLVYKSGETSWWRCHWLIKFWGFFFTPGRWPEMHRCLTTRSISPTNFQKYFLSCSHWKKKELAVEIVSFFGH